MLQFGQMKKGICKTQILRFLKKKFLVIGKNLSKEVVFPNSKIEVKVIDVSDKHIME